MTRPKLELEKDGFDWVIEIITFLLFAGLIITPFYYYSALPDTIPSHYNAAGEADGFSGKNVIWTLPAIGLVMFIGLTILNRFPHIFNYPTEVTEENAERLYRGGTKLIRVLNMVTIGAFFYISLQSIMGAMGSNMGLGDWFLPVFLASTFIPIGVYIYLTIKGNK
ncbi:DUF1648 domain-containing protein [Marinoscillum sp.]|uniref:DUF1648 domain-containing protein n=1 Tax=Marinoscillum sp. TaxID=2024838 RepID=UPI003BABD45B